MGEIHYPCYAENNRQAKRHESVNEAGHEPGDQDIEESGEIKGHCNNRSIEFLGLAPYAETFIDEAKPKDLISTRRLRMLRSLRMIRRSSFVIHNTLRLVAS